MQPYFEAELKDTLKKVSALGEGFRFVLLSDSHYDPKDPKKTEKENNTHQNILAFAKAFPTDAIVHLGDLLFAKNGEDETNFFNDANIDRLYGQLRERFAQANENTFFVAGNHDEHHMQEPVRENFFRRMVLPQKQRITALVENEPYYYVDFPEKQVRCIFLMSSHQENGEQCYGMYKKQADWLSTDALQAPDGWKILLFSHVHPGPVGYSKENIEEFVGLLWAFQEKTRFTSEVFSADFRNATSAKLAALFVGHSHVDWVEQPGRLPCPAVMIGSNCVHMPSAEKGWPMPDGAVVPRRVYGTVTEDLWDVVVVRDDGIHTVRFGAGEDRFIAF